MPLLTVHCRRDPFAAVEIRDGSYATVGVGTGEVIVEVPAGTYEVVAAAAGCEDTRTVQVTSADVNIEMKLGAYPSAAPTGRSSTHVDAHGAAAQSLSEHLVARAVGGAAIGIMLRRPAGAGTGVLPRRIDGKLPVQLVSDHQMVEMTWTPGLDERTGEYATAGVGVAPGAHVAVIGDDPATSLVVPAWDGWQTLLFLPVTAGGIAASMAVMHVIPCHVPWRPTLPLAELLDHLHWAMIERPELTDQCLVALNRETNGDLGSSPLLHLLLAGLASTARGALAVAQARESLGQLSEPGGTAAVTSDVVALWLALTPRPVTETVRASAMPLLARSADILIDHECRAPGGIAGSAADAMATRLASPLWFRWSPAGDMPPGERIASFDDNTWREELSRAASSVARLTSLDGVALHADPSLPRLVAYLHDESRRRGVTPADVLLQAHPAEVIRGSGLPAIGALRALRALGHAGGPPHLRENRHPQPPPDEPASPTWLRAVLGFVVAIVLGTVLWWVWRAVSDDDTPATTVTLDTMAGTVTTSAPVTTLAATPIAPITSPTLTSPTPSPPTTSPTTAPQPNVAPVAQPLERTVLQDTPFSDRVTGTDQDGDDLTARVVDAPPFGQFELQPDGSFNFVPDSGSGQTATFTFVVNDGRIDSPPAAGALTVLPSVKAAPAPADEGDGVLHVTVALTVTGTMPDRPVVVDVTALAGSATPGADFAPPSTPMTFDVGSVDQQLDIPLINDDLDEGDEYFTLRLAVRFDGPAVPVDTDVVIGDSTDAIVE